MTFNLGREGLVLEPLFKKLPSAKQEFNCLISQERTEFIPRNGLILQLGLIPAARTVMKASQVLAGDWYEWTILGEMGSWWDAKGPTWPKGLLFSFYEFGYRGRNLGL